MLDMYTPPNSPSQQASWISPNELISDVSVSEVEQNAEYVSKENTDCAYFDQPKQQYSGDKLSINNCYRNDSSDSDDGSDVYEIYGDKKGHSVGEGEGEGEESDNKVVVPYRNDALVTPHRDDQPTLEQFIQLNQPGQYLHNINVHYSAEMGAASHKGMSNNAVTPFLPPGRINMNAVEIALKKMSLRKVHNLKPKKLTFSPELETIIENSVCTHPSSRHASEGSSVEGNPQSRLVASARHALVRYLNDESEHIPLRRCINGIENNTYRSIIFFNLYRYNPELWTNDFIESSICRKFNHMSRMCLTQHRSSLGSLSDVEQTFPPPQSSDEIIIRPTTPPPSPTTPNDDNDTNIPERIDTLLQAVGTILLTYGQSGENSAPTVHEIDGDNETSEDNRDGNDMDNYFPPTKKQKTE